MIVRTPGRHHYYFDERRHAYHLVPPALAALIDPGPGSDREAEAQAAQAPGSDAERDYYRRKAAYWREHGLLDDGRPPVALERRLTRTDVERQLANLRQITFEVTERCDLQCAYCGYGSLYANRDPRDLGRRMSWDATVRLIEHLKPYWDSPLNQSARRRIYVSFYGGEPLLNFPFIEKAVAYFEALESPRYFFRFSMTTNAVSLDRYQDFLAAHDVDVLVSLDGDECHHSYRVFHNGRPSFPRVIQNLRALRERHPDYFRRKIHFNAVLHNRNSVEEVFRFIHEQFGKEPNIAELNTAGVAPDKQDEFRRLYANVQESLDRSASPEAIQDGMFMKLPNLQSLGIFLQEVCQMSFADYLGAMVPAEEDLRSSTGTCLPFEKKMFVTAQGRLLPCERIGHEHGLGQVSDDGVELDPDAIAAKYNELWGRFDKLCSACHQLSACKQCLFNLDLTQRPSRCQGFMNARDRARYIGDQLAFLEENRDYYQRILTKVVVI